MLKNSRFIFIYVFLLVAGYFVHTHEDLTVPVNKPFSEFPMAVNNWKMVSESVFDQAILDNLRPTDYLVRRYRGIEDTDVALYIGYHAGGKDSGPIHSPKNCLPGSGWFQLNSREEMLKMGGGDHNVMLTTYQNGEDKELFLYFFYVKGAVLTDEYALKFDTIKNSMLYRRRDAAFIRVSIPFESDQSYTEDIGLKFIKDFYPVIKEFLPG